MSSIVNKIKDEVGDASIPSGQHLAAILRSKGSALEVNHRPTPTLGANDLLIEVKSIALNPVDWYQREYGFPPISYPVVISSYIAGTVVSAGSSVPFDAPKPGTRVSDKCPVSSPKAPQTTAPSRRVCLSRCERGATAAGDELQQGKFASHGGRDGVVRVVYYRCAA